MRKNYWRMIFTGLVVVSLAGVPVNAQEAGSGEIEEKAMTSFKRMAGFLAKTQSFKVRLDIGFDVVQDSGQKIEYGETRELVLKRPNHIRIDSTKRDGATSRFSFDGKSIAVFNAGENVYASVAKTGTLDEAIDYFLDDLDMRLPLAWLCAAKLPQTVQERIWAADYVEQATIAGVACDHIAVRATTVDLQLWIAQGDQPVPQRILITYRGAVGQPQFWAQFSDWSLSPRVPDTLFTFTPPQDAIQINIVPSVRNLAQSDSEGGE